MTQDAISAGNAIQAGIAALQKGQTELVNAVTLKSAHLPKADTETIINTIMVIHKTHIAEQQAALAALPADYVKPAPPVKTTAATPNK